MEKSVHYIDFLFFPNVLCVSPLQRQWSGSFSNIKERHQNNGPIQQSSIQLLFIAFRVSFHFPSKRFTISRKISSNVIWPQTTILYVIKWNSENKSFPWKTHLWNLQPSQLWLVTCIDMHAAAWGRYIGPCVPTPCGWKSSAHRLRLNHVFQFSVCLQLKLGLYSATGFT